jgi:NitT/TauT family transport system substrate-binding protein
MLDSMSPALYIARTSPRLMTLSISLHPFARLANYSLLCLFAFPIVLPAQDLGRLTVAYSSRSIAPIDYFIAEQSGIFKAESLDVRLVQIRAAVAVAAMLASEVEVLGSISTAISAAQRGAPIKVLAVTLHRPLFWLVARPEFKNVSDLKGKVMGVVSIGGAQHTALRYMLRKGGLNPDVDGTTILAGDVPAQLQALASNAIQAAALSPPIVIVARDRFKMNVLASVLQEYPTIQNGVATTERTLKEEPKLIRALLRARGKASRLFHENPTVPIDVISKVLHVDKETARETYFLSKPGFTQNGIVSEGDAREYLKADAERLKLREPASVSRIFDFTLQEQVNAELGVR